MIQYLIYWVMNYTITKDNNWNCLHFIERPSQPSQDDFTI